MNVSPLSCAATTKFCQYAQQLLWSSVCAAAALNFPRAQSLTRNCSFFYSLIYCAYADSVHSVFVLLCALLWQKKADNLLESLQPNSWQILYLYQVNPAAKTINTNKLARMPCRTQMGGWMFSLYKLTFRALYIWQFFRGSIHFNQLI